MKYRSYERILKDVLKTLPCEINFVNISIKQIIKQNVKFKQALQNLFKPHEFPVTNVIFIAANHKKLDSPNYPIHIKF